MVTATQIRQGTLCRRVYEEELISFTVLMACSLTTESYILIFFRHRNTLNMPCMKKTQKKWKGFREA